MPVDWVILNWYACSAGGRAIGRRSRDLIPKFLEWVEYHIFLGMGLRSSSSAKKSIPKQSETTG